MTTMTTMIMIMIMMIVMIKERKKHQNVYINRARWHTHRQTHLKKRIHLHLLTHFTLTHLQSHVYHPRLRHPSQSLQQQQLL